MSENQKIFKETAKAEMVQAISEFVVRQLQSGNVGFVSSDLVKKAWNKEEPYTLFLKGFAQLYFKWLSESEINMDDVVLELQDIFPYNDYLAVVERLADVTPEPQETVDEPSSDDTSNVN